MNTQIKNIEDAKEQTIAALELKNGSTAPFFIIVNDLIEIATSKGDNFIEWNMLTIPVHLKITEYNIRELSSSYSRGGYIVERNDMTLIVKWELF